MATIGTANFACVTVLTKFPVTNLRKPSIIFNSKGLNISFTERFSYNGGALVLGLQPQ